jgi:hypothetical protein
MENMPESTGIEGTKGVSNSTIVVLILLALIMTVIGTWAVMNSIHNQEQLEEQYGGGTNIGRVSFTIIPVEKYTDKSTGLILLNIQN